jgi:hypothetical protein
MEPQDTDPLSKFFEKANRAGAVVATIKIEAVPEQLSFERSFVVTRRSMTRLTELIDELNEDRLS